MIDFNAFSNEIFQILRSYEKDIVLYDDNGTRVFEPADARRMYVIGDNLLVSIVEDGDNSALKFYLSPSFNLSQVEGLLNTLRTISVQSNLLFHVKKYNKEIKPKDFAMQSAIKEQQESYMNIMEGLYGTSKSSYLKLENARMIVRHSARVNERVIGARGRHISAIFVENQEGERLRFPVNLLSGARAMTQHVSNGGNFADEVGSQIIRMARDFSNLAQVTGHINVMPGIAEAVKVKEPKIEAYGVKGMTSKQWRKVFKNAAAMEKWCDDHDAEVHGTTKVEESISETVSTTLALRAAVIESMSLVKRSFDRIYRADTYMKEAAQLVSGQNLSEDVDAIAADATRLKEMLGEGVSEEAIMTVARMITLESLNQPLAEDEGDSMGLEEESTIQMYKGEIPEDTPCVGSLPESTLVDRVWDDFVENQTIVTIEGIDIKGQVVFFFPHFGEVQGFDQSTQDQLASEFEQWCYELEAEMESVTDESVMMPEDDMEEARVKFKVPGNPLGECANHPAIKQFDAWLESFDPDAMFGTTSIKEDDDMGDDMGDEQVDETFNGQLEAGDNVTISARGPHFGKRAVIASVPGDSGGMYTVMVAGIPFKIERHNFDIPQLMSQNVAEPEMTMEDMAPQINDKWIVFGTMGVNGKFRKKFDDEAARDDWMASHDQDDRFEITGTQDPDSVDEGALRVGSRAYNEVSRLASSNIDRSAEEKRRAKEIKAKADLAKAEAHQKKMGNEVDEDMRVGNFHQPYTGPKQDYSKQAAEIEKMNVSVAPSDRDVFNSVLNSCLNTVDPENKLSIAQCLDLLSPERVERLVRDLREFEYADAVNEAFDPEPVAGDTVTVTAAGKYQGKTATIVTAPADAATGTWVVSIDGANKNTSRKSFEFKATVKEGTHRFGYDKSINESRTLHEGKNTRYEITKTKGDRTYKQEGTLEELIKAYSYTLETGASYSHEKGNAKINRKPANIASLVKNLNNAVNNSAANGYAGVDFTSKVLAEKVSEAKNDMGETEYATYSGWKAAAKKADASVWFDGDKDIGQAMVGTKPFKKGETKSIGEWDGEKGCIFKSAVKESTIAESIGTDVMDCLGDGGDPIDVINAYAKKKGITAAEAKKVFAKEMGDSYDTIVRGYDDAMNEGKSFKRNDDDSVDVKAKKKEDQKKREAKKQPVDEARVAKSPAYEKAYNEMKALKRELKDATGGPAKERKAIEAKIEAKQKELTKLDTAKVVEAKETLEAKVARLQKEYADCDDFPTARHDLKAELDKAKAELKDSKKVSESVCLTAGTLFKLLGEGELLFAKRINESKVLVANAEGQERWFESTDLNIDPKSIKTLAEDAKVEKSTFSEEMTQNEWQEAIKKAYPFKVSFRETGKGGWSTLNVDSNGPRLDPSQDENWWVNASPIDGPMKNSGKLIGSYGMNKGVGIGKIFFKLKD